MEFATLIDCHRFEDSRGIFMRAFDEDKLKTKDIVFDPVACNVVRNTHKKTLRGMHSQKKPFSEKKLITCIKGAIWDVVVDIRRDSENFLCWQKFYLSEENNAQLYIPHGYLHGYLTVKNDSIVHYASSCKYAPTAEEAYRWDDPAFGIEWPFTPAIISEKDLNHEPFQK